MAIVQGFPPPNSKFIDPSGTIVASWRQFLLSLYHRTGGATGKDGYFAFVNGNSAQVFNVSTALTSTEATPLAQVQSLIRTLEGSTISAISLTPSPMAWTATVNGTISIGGNGVQSISIQRGISSVSIAKNYGQLSIRKGDQITIKYIGTPVLNLIPD